MARWWALWGWSWHSWGIKSDDRFGSHVALASPRLHHRFGGDNFVGAGAGEYVGGKLGSLVGKQDAGSHAGFLVGGGVGVGVLFAGYLAAITAYGTAKALKNAASRFADSAPV